MNSFKIYLSVLVIILSFLLFVPASAQTLTPNTNFDDYSDTQIKQWVQQSGKTDEQLIQVAQSQGVPAAQIQRLQSRLADIRSKGNNGTDTTNQSSSRSLGYQQNTVQRPIRSDLLNGIGPKIFGASVFRNSDINTFTPDLNIPTPINYIVGAKDQLHISVSGINVASWDPIVSPEGNITLSRIRGGNVLNVAGKTIEQVTAALKNKLSANNYAIDKGAYLTVTLGNIRSIKVTVQGMVIKPAAYTVTSLSTVMMALYAAGGPNDIGSFRRIELIRNNKKIRTLDVYDILAHGNGKDNIVLRDQDIINVPAYDVRVELKEK